MERRKFSRELSEQRIRECYQTEKRGVSCKETRSEHEDGATLPDRR
jgi:hypothetical protein